MNTNLPLAARTTLLLGSLITFTIPALAVPITGGFGTTGPGVLSFATPGAGVGGTPVFKIDFCPPQASSPTTPDVGAPITASCNGAISPAGTGLLAISGGTGDFPAFPFPGVSGTILDIASQPAAGYTTFPVGPGSSIDNFLTIGALPGYNFRATEFVNQTCVETGTVKCLGGFVLTQVGAGVSVSMSIRGTLFAPGYDPTSFIQIITGQFDNTNITAVSDAAQTEDGVFSNTLSGSVTMIAPVTQNEVPEPATLTMFGIAAAAIAISRLRTKGGSAPK